MFYIAHLLIRAFIDYPTWFKVIDIIFTCSCIFSAALVIVLSRKSRD